MRPNSLAGYRSDLTHPHEAFGTYRIQDVTQEPVEDLVNKLAEKGKSKRTVGKMLGTTRSVYQLALRKNVLRVNPVDDVQPIGRPKRERDALTSKELEAIRRAVVGNP